jgi:hypothetical protein
MTPVELIQDLFAAFGRGDIAYILANVAPDCQWIAPGEGIPNSGHYTGPEGVARFFENLAASETVTAFEPRQFFSSGNDVVALGYEACTVNANGRSVGTNWAMHFTVRDGKLARFESYYDTAAYARAHAA